MTEGRFRGPSELDQMSNFERYIGRENSFKLPTNSISLLQVFSSDEKCVGTLLIWRFMVWFGNWWDDGSAKRGPPYDFFCR